MIPTSVILAKAIAFIQGLSIFDSVVSQSGNDLESALANLRDNPTRLAILIPGADSFDYFSEADFSLPDKTEVITEIIILITGRAMDMRLTGAPSTMDDKDALVDAIMGSDLGESGLIALPDSCEPIGILFEGQAHGREAWKLTLKVRQFVAF